MHIKKHKEKVSSTTTLSLQRAVQETSEMEVLKANQLMQYYKTIFNYHFITGLGYFLVSGCILLQPDPPIG